MAAGAHRAFSACTLPMRGLHTQTLGVLGSGAIGGKLIEFAKAFGMTILHIERQGVEKPREGYVTFEHGLSHSDVLSLHCPLNEQTRGLIGPKTLPRMKKGAILINTARGGLVQFDALKQAIESGHLGGAALDVLDVEPPARSLDGAVAAPALHHHATRGLGY